MRIKKQKNNKTFIVWFLAILAIAGVVILTVETVTSGAELAALEKNERTLLDEKRVLEERMAKNSSLNEFEKKAEELGFAKTSKILYISGKEEVAKLP
jgi:hypothetical protein